LYLYILLYNICIFLKRPPRFDSKATTLLSTAAGEKSERSALPGGGLGEIGRQIWAVLSIPTFLIIVLQVLDSFCKVGFRCRLELGLFRKLESFVFPLLTQGID